MNCKFCGQPLEEGKRFCSNCGAPIMDPAPTSPQPNTQTNKTPFSGPMSAAPTPAALPKKNGISKEKTVFFWASKAAFVVALLLFLMPFMKISFSESSKLGQYAKPVVMSGRELVLGMDDDNDAKEHTENSLRNSRVMLAAILIGFSIFMTKGGAVTSAIGAAFLALYMKRAENSYSFMNKTIAEWDGLIVIKFQPALYAALIITITGAVLAGIDQSKRRKMFQQEQEFGGFDSFGGYM